MCTRLVLNVEFYPPLLLRAGIKGVCQHVEPNEELLIKGGGMGLETPGAPGKRAYLLSLNGHSASPDAAFKPVCFGDAVQCSEGWAG